jgi:hypothetical protein
MIRNGLAFLVCTMFWLLGTGQTNNQLEANKLRVVHIALKANGERGSGFIVATSDSAVYVVTANHVIERRDKKDASDVEVIIKNKSYAGIPIVETDSGSLILHNDIALIKVIAPGFKFTPCVVVEDPDNCEDLFFIRSTADKRKYPERSYGSFEYWIGDATDAYIIHLKDIIPGDSGSALFEKDTITGMIVSKIDSRSRVLSMKRIDEVLSKSLPSNCRFKFIKRLAD